ncbi:hypothetical protein ACFOYW_08205 [Gryllotalpicola reticulitermitis]|uniref:LPXTG-motif cell wall anchor domain-containing protein n=1 Tax=Gryllotalpicola reticulitermitis TaxID=1184153 RepID=A0ABV8Q867_9MICO
MKKLTKAVAASALVAGALFAVPAAANAATYTPNVPTTYTVNVGPGGTFNLVIANGTFIANSTLNISISSTGPVPTDVTAAVFHSATATATGSANANGGTTLSGTVPTDATAPITLTAQDPAGDSATVTIAAAATTTTTTTTSTTGLATTGTYISLATVWGAVGLVALGGGAIAVRQISRKRQGDNA